MKNHYIVYDPKVDGWDPLFLNELNGMSYIVSDKLRVKNSEAIQHDLVRDGFFMFKNNIGTTPANGYLTGGTSATSVAGTWAAVTDGEFTITIDGVAYDITAIDFTGAADMDAVAVILQAAIRAATGNTFETVVWSTNKFIITARQSVSITSAVSGGSGTDISGAGGTAFLDAETGRGTATSGTDKKFGLIQLSKGIQALFHLRGATLVMSTIDEGGNEETTEYAWDDTNWTGEDIKFEIDLTCYEVKFKVNGTTHAYHETYVPKGLMGIYLNNADADNMDISYIEGRAITEIERAKNIRAYKRYVVMDAQKAVGAGLEIDCLKFRHAKFTIITAGGGATDSMTIKLQESAMQTTPAFDSAVTPTNDWDYVDGKKSENGADVDGDTGLVIAYDDVGNDREKIRVNSDGQRWLTANITANNDTDNFAATIILELFND